ncbi:MAG TPA: hypothetical protein VJL34_02615 [Anaerolineales bacterium]|nr:hypothetical protein [Anaerolineales bacterium]
MGKYDKYSSQSRQAEKPWDIHPIWRGIGCLMMLLVPVMSYAGAVLLVEANQEKGWIVMPRELMAKISVPVIGPVEHLWGNLLFALALSLIGFALLTALYALVYQFIGPPRYGPLDAPPERRRARGRR